MSYLLHPIIFLEMFFIFFSPAANETDDLYVELFLGGYVSLGIIIYLIVQWIQRRDPERAFGELLLRAGLLNLFILILGFWDVLRFDFTYYLREWKNFDEENISTLVICIYLLVGYQIIKLIPYLDYFFSRRKKANVRL